MITNTLLILILSAGAVGYIKLNMEFKELKAATQCKLDKIEYSVEGAFSGLENQIKYGNVAICNHLDMVEENTAELINQRTRDINFITTRETNKVIFTPLKIECERCK